MAEPVFVLEALLRAGAVGHIVAVLDRRHDHFIGVGDAHAAALTLLHVDLAVVHIPQARVDLILQAEHVARTHILECHREPSVFAVRVPEDEDCEALVVGSVPDP